MLRRVFVFAFASSLFVIGAVLPALALEGDKYCQGSTNTCGKLLVHFQNGSLVSDGAKTFTTNGVNRDLRVIVNWEHHNTFGWHTEGSTDSGTVHSTTVTRYVDFTCTQGAEYKFYSTHWLNGSQFANIDGTIFYGNTSCT